MNPTMLVGLALALVGFLLFAGTLFGAGGVAKSEQFRVMGEVMSGRQGPGRKRAMGAGFALMVFGVLTLFAGVAAKDAGRDTRCQAYCTQQGYPQSALGPAEETPPGGGRTVRYFACICTRPDGTHTQTRANDL